MKCCCNGNICEEEEGDIGLSGSCYFIVTLSDFNVCVHFLYKIQKAEETMKRKTVLYRY